MGVMEQVLDTNPMKIHSDYGTFSEPPLHGEGAVKGAGQNQIPITTQEHNISLLRSSVVLSKIL